MPEVWMPVPFLTQYEVSDKGRVRNTWTGRVLKPFKGYGKNGRHYRKVNLWHRGERFPQFVHRLVMMAFYEADHKDRQREHNDLSNIEPVLRRENDSRWRNGQPTAGVCPNCKGVGFVKL